MHRRFAAAGAFLAIACADEPARDADAPIPIERVAADPAAHNGRTVTGEATVVDIATDRGIWLDVAGHRLFMLTNRPLDPAQNMHAGQRIRILEGVIRDPAFLVNLPGPRLDDATRRIADAQPALLTVYESNIAVVD